MTDKAINDQKIWCLFSIANDYNQPDNNLVAWFRKKPDAVILSFVTNNQEEIERLLIGERVRISYADFRLRCISEGKVIEERNDR